MRRKRGVRRRDRGARREEFFEDIYLRSPVRRRPLVVPVQPAFRPVRKRLVEPRVVRTVKVEKSRNLDRLRSGLFLGQKRDVISTSPKCVNARRVRRANFFKAGGGSRRRPLDTRRHVC